MCQNPLRAVLCALASICVAFTTWLWTAPAAACGSCTCYGPGTWSSDFGALKAPRNARLLIPAPDASALNLRTMDGTSVESVVDPAGAEGLFWIRAKSLLTSGTSYIVEVAGKPDSGLYFEVESDTDQQPIVVDDVALAASEGSPICDLTWGAQLIVGSLRDDAQPGRRVIAQLDVTIAGTTQRAFLPFNAFTQMQQAEIGIAADADPAKCIFGRMIEQAGANLNASASVTFFDLGGNASKVPDPFEFTFGAVQGGACGPIAGTGGNKLPTQAGSGGSGAPKPPSGGAASLPGKPAVNIAGSAATSTPPAGGQSSSTAAPAGGQSASTGGAAAPAGGRSADRAAAGAAASASGGCNVQPHGREAGASALWLALAALLLRAGRRARAAQR